MIIFNGVDLDLVAPVKIVDIRVSPISMTPVARQRPISWGADFVRLTGGSRTVTIEFALLTNDRTIRQYQLRAITKWARSETPKRLMLPNHEGVYLEAICTALPEPSLRQWWESKLRIVFTTYDNPYWTNIAEKSVACGTSFTVLGDAPPLMRIENTFASTAYGQEYTNGTESMQFISSPSGAMVIDLNKQTAAVNGTSIMDKYEFNSSFLIPRTGTQTIEGAGTVKWRERWE